MAVSTQVNYLFTNGGKALGSVLRPHVKDVEFSL